MLNLIQHPPRHLAWTMNQAQGDDNLKLIIKGQEDDGIHKEDVGGGDWVVFSL